MRLSRPALFRSALPLIAAALCLTAALPAEALDRRVKVVNRTNFTVTHFYGSNAGSNSWEEDILGSDTLGPGQAVTINFDDGTGYCKFDFRVVFNDGDVVEQRGVDVCTIGTLNIN